MMEKQRFAWVDTAKGWGMLAIIVSHVMTGHPISRWLYTFHVPLFFFLSGFLFRGEKPWGAFLKGKVRRMVIPYFVLAVPIVLGEAAFYGGRRGFWEQVGEMSLGVLLQRRMWPIWFLACLFLLELLAYWLVRLVRKPVLLAIAALVMGALGVLYSRAGLPVLPWNLDACFGVMPFFMAGYLLKGNGKLLAFLERGKGRGLLLAVLAAGNLLFGASAVLGAVPGMDVFKNQYGVPCLSYPAAFCGIGAVILASQWLTMAPVRYLGRNSLVYFVWHQTPVITAIYYYFPRWGIPMADYPSRLAMLGEKGLELAIILVLLTLCNELLGRPKLKWMLGK